MATTIQELARSGQFRGTQQHRIAEPQSQTMPEVIDNSTRGKPKIQTSVDAYVSGQYLGKNGRTIEVVQRYSIVVSYSADTQQQTMEQVRAKILQQFQSQYGGQLNVSNVFVPSLKPPPADVDVKGGGVAPIEMYEGSRTFREMTRTQRLRYDIGTQKSIANTNIGSLRKRYSL